MKAYRVIARNSACSVDQGAVWREFFVFSLDFIGATMDAEKAVTELRKRLVAAGLPRDSADSLDIEKIEFEAEVVVSVGELRVKDGQSESVEAWARRVAEQTKKDMNS